uniref:Protein kinase and pp2c-like domain-containing n=1 Tax=Tetraselmis sp. GSL018 TaxID=582737 RepID=A0A061SFA0_9CHLO|mmetsp:Transcript_18384/g.43960  ORF Transcript_18384/g.43960 Transcript_18384/m.43960 type:complete len:664 (+) Transcript_18384:137-2128(+)|eukprot:CAMPEP_0177590958 /NCGR_PEP_ID=MMETSP0419_2-20121207/7709_1 /TAXON_ID=582737 /ORGANISM="Tetraselmis sp., Strain GSL018" /LENGTH=663 /DNA_ID=CAMNT_0019081603 /DNA_START=78 /DNA_END=2069 /DNA_ORIENTATION=-
MTCEVRREDIELLEKLSEGAESVVYSAVFNGQNVAAKRYKIRTSADLERFRKELDILKKLEHPNVVSLLGAKQTPPDRLVVMPLAESNLAQEIHETGWRPSWGDVLCTAKNIGSGLDHLHALGVVHCDLKPANVLLFQGRQRPVITDMGISELAEVLDAARGDRSSLLQGVSKPSGGFHKRRMAGTLEYMAPEVLLKEPQSFASDVYAWAVVVNELATATVPFSDCTKDNPACHTVLEMGYGRAELAAAVASEGLRPLLRGDTPPALASLLEACWRLDPRERPTVRQALQELDAMDLPSTLSAPRTSITKPKPSEAEQVVDAHHHASGVGLPNGPKAFSKPAISRSGMSAGVYDTPGSRGEDRMEDRHLLVESLGSGGPLLLGVFDGHRGEEAAAHMAERLEAELSAALQLGPPDQALARAFAVLDESFARLQDAAWSEKVTRMGADAAGLRTHFPGCTALAALIFPGEICIANAGDCRAVLCRAGKAVQVTRDHTLADDEERQRVAAAGGRVSWKVDGWRVGPAAIQVSRSIGDHDLRDQGLTPEPEVSNLQITDADEFLVVASDGLFDVLNNDEVVGLVHDTVKDPKMCGQRLATEALTRGSNDNVTVGVVFLKPVSTLESIYSSGQQKYAITPTLYGTRQEMLAAYSRGAAADEMRDMCY